MKIQNILFAFIFALLACANKGNKSNEKIAVVKISNTMEANSNSKKDTAVFGEGCFWCIEPMYTQLKGVDTVVVGFSGGTTKNPTYEEVCTGTTGHTEVAEIVFDPTVISYQELLKVFWKTHDPTTLNRQGADVGVQYRSVIFYTNETQKKEAEHYKNELTLSGAFDKPIVTAIEPLKVFYPAEHYHQDYYIHNPNKPYCEMVVKPKLEKFEKAFHNKLK